MALLIVGLLMFTLGHLFPAVARPARDRLVGKLGDRPYQGVFSLFILTSIVVIVFGWKSTTPAPVYTPVLAPGLVASGLMLAASVLFIAAVLPTNVKRLIRHPQMTGTLAWSIAHLLANGDSRSIVLFGGVGLWSIAEMLLCNKRDGSWQKPERVSVTKDAISIVIGIVLFTVFAYFHGALFGVSVVLRMEGI